MPGHSLRRLWPSDRDRVLAYFLRLDPETRANRFMGNVGEAGVRAYAERSVVADGLMFGAFVDGELRGLGELRPAGPHPAGLLGAQAEAAFAV
ncbi:GNAT family N-acetyltransferase, partial [Methylobacterium trifolii]